MKRIQSACICQTLHFELKDGEEHDTAVKQVREEVRRYKEDLTRKHIQHRILEEKTLDDGSIILKIRKQYNTSPVGDYLD